MVPEAFGLMKLLALWITATNVPPSDERASEMRPCDLAGTQPFGLAI